MGVFTQLGVRELTEVAAAFGLGAVRRHETIAAGTINSNFELETDRGRFFVRVNEGKAEVDVAWEARLVAALAENGVVTPPPILAVDGRPYAPLASERGKWVSVFPWRSGVHLAPSEVTADSAGKLGEALARLHAAGLALPTTWRRGSIYDHDHLTARFDRFASSLDPALAHAISILGEELAIAAEAAPVRRRATWGLIHGDLFRDNVLWEGGVITAILDFEQASGGSLAYDLAVCLNDWCWTGRPELPLARALLEGYQRVRPLTPGDREALPIEVRAAATRFTITRITDVYLARVTNPEKDFRAFLARVEAWRGPALGQLSSLL
ncbi:MAG: homoserine kinase [Myxococcales bacterium]|nr:homoserine kinase [Myxococcales bacterium]